ncbi:unnamed protein product [Ranitomeya imitator]|uniref:Chromaffin granule amine transporter n=1 Tax=Ranitomeya imitator TaxID=111125 RepID=A0ABN9LC29_9NEOB|nr:unnamed protein product [Ranitomeya imitator]
MQSSDRSARGASVTGRFDPQAPEGGPCGAMMECGLCRWLNEKRGSRQVTLAVVFVALLLDNMLFTVVVPIIPSFLYEKEHKNENTSVVQASSPSASNSSFTIYSLYDNSTFSIIDSNQQVVATKTQEVMKNGSCNVEANVLQDENVQVGLLFASKAIVQLLFNPIVGIITSRVGYDIPMFCGFVILFLSTLIFAFARSYALMFFARSLQGLGSSFSTVAGLGMVANIYTDDYERGQAMGIALGGLAVGVLSKYYHQHIVLLRLVNIGLSSVKPFSLKFPSLCSWCSLGSVMYEFVGKASPFLVLAGLALLDGVLQLCTLRPTKFSPGSIPATSYSVLLTDPYVMVAAGALCIANMAIGVMEPTLPIWMMETMCSPNWELGTCYANLVSRNMHIIRLQSVYEPGSNCSVSLQHLHRRNQVLHGSLQNQLVF